MPKVQSGLDYCHKCIVWHLEGNVVEDEFDAGDDQCFPCKDCSNADPITDGDDSTTDDGSFHPIVRGDGNEVFNGHADFLRITVLRRLRLPITMTRSCNCF